jgi:DNA-binding XRE family transcriptional regulator
MTVATKTRVARNSLALELEEIENDRDRVTLMLARMQDANDEFLPFEMIERMLDGENHVKVWREHRDLTVRALAEKAGVSPSLVSEIETGKKEGSIATLKALARALDLTLDDLAG